MFKCTVVLLAVLAMARFPQINGFCQVGDCSISDSSNCSWPELVKHEYYKPVEQFAPRIDNPDHIFNLMYPQDEKNCINIRIARYVNDKGEFELHLFLLCTSIMRSEYVLFFKVNLSFSNDQARVSCFERETRTIEKSYCGLFVHEQLRLTFLENDNRLLIEDLSDKVPAGAWIMLQRREMRENKKCVCLNLNSYWAEIVDCSSLKNGEGRPNQNKLHDPSRRQSSAKWIIYSFVGGFLLLLPVAVLLCVEFKMFIQIYGVQRILVRCNKNCN